MTTLSSASSSPPIREDFRKAPFTYVPLNERGCIVRKYSVALEISFREVRAATSLADAAMLSIMGLYERLNLCGCPRRYTTVREMHSVTLSPLNPIESLNAYIDRQRISHPLDLQARILSESVECSDPLSYSMDLQTRIIEVLRRHGMKVDTDALSRLLTAREQALVLHREDTTKVVSVSSRSPYFKSVNTVIRRNNKSLEASRESNAEIPSFCLASLRIFPNGSSALTMPGLVKWKGANKAVSCDVLIKENGSDAILMRRTKLLKERRIAYSEKYNRSLELMSSVESPYVLLPKIFFLHPTKGVQTLSDHCEGDIFAFIEPYFYLKIGVFQLNDPLVRHITSAPIAEQVRQTLAYMQQMTQGLMDIHEKKILHNDVKPENVLRKVEPDGSSKPMIADFDFACSLDEGLSKKCTFGTAYYKPHAIEYRNMSTELFALARSFWMDHESARDAHACFMHIFDALHLLAQSKQPELAEKIAKLRDSLKILCSNMKKGIFTSRGRFAFTYDDVILALHNMSVPFSSMRHGSAASGAGAAASTST